MVQPPEPQTHWRPRPEGTPESRFSTVVLRPFRARICVGLIYRWLHHRLISVAPPAQNSKHFLKRYSFVITLSSTRNFNLHLVHARVLRHDARTRSLSCFNKLLNNGDTL